MLEETWEVERMSGGLKNRSQKHFRSREKEEQTHQDKRIYTGYLKFHTVHQDKRIVRQRTNCNRTVKKSE